MRPQKLAAQLDEKDAVYSRASVMTAFADTIPREDSTTGLPDI